MGERVADRRSQTLSESLSHLRPSSPDVTRSLRSWSSPQNVTPGHVCSGLCGGIVAYGDECAPTLVRGCRAATRPRNNGERRVRLLIARAKGEYCHSRWLCLPTDEAWLPPLALRRQCYQPYPRTSLQFIYAIEIAGLHTFFLVMLDDFESSNAGQRLAPESAHVITLLSRNFCLNFRSRPGC